MKRILLLFAFLPIQQLSYSQEKLPEVIFRGNDTLLLITIPQAKECISHKKNNDILMELNSLYENIYVPELKRSIEISDSLTEFCEKELLYVEEKLDKTVAEMYVKEKNHEQEVKKYRRQRNVIGAISLILGSLLIIK